MHSVLRHAASALGQALQTEGDRALLDAPRRLLLVSRAERAPTPATPWLRGAIEAAQALLAGGEILVAGAGRTGWDAASWTCREKKGAAIIALDSEPDRKLLHTFVPQKHLLVWPENPLPFRAKNERLQLRDRLAGALATCAFAIHLRKGGNMSAVAARLAERGCPVETFSAVRSALRGSSQGRASAAPSLLRSGPHQEFDGRLTHFTRAPEGVWPEEAYADYLKWLCSGPIFQPRDGFQTLRRILAERKLRGCGRLIRGREAMVCFTARAPHEILAQSNYRKGLARWTFSPYGLSFIASDLARFGAKPVQYASSELVALAPPETLPFMQTIASGDMNWQWESEWRVQGDLNFETTKPGRLRAIVADSNEAARIEAEFGVEARAFQAR